VPNSSNELDFSGFIVTPLINCTISLIGSVWLRQQKGGPILAPLKLGESVSDGGCFTPKPVRRRDGATKNVVRCLPGILYSTNKQTSFLNFLVQRLPLNVSTINLCNPEGQLYAKSDFVKAQFVDHIIYNYDFDFSVFLWFY
jgi:hypothetical protein